MISRRSIIKALAALPLLGPLALARVEEEVVIPSDLRRVVFAAPRFYTFKRGKVVSWSTAGPVLVPVEFLTLGRKKR